MRRQRRRGPQRARRFAPGAGVAARDHPVDEAGDDARAGHDFEMAPDDAVEAERVGIERDQTEIAGEADDAAAERVGQHAPDIERLGDQDHDHRRQQRKAAEEDEAEAEHDIDRVRIDRTAGEIGKFRKQHRADHDDPRHQAGGEEAEQDDEQAADQCHEIRLPSLRATAKSTSHPEDAATDRVVERHDRRPEHSWLRDGSWIDCVARSAMTPVVNVDRHRINPSSPWRAAPGARAPTVSRSPISTGRRPPGCRGRAACAPARNSRR